MILDIHTKDHYKYELFDANGAKLDGSGKPPLTIGGEPLTETVFVPYPLKTIKYD